MLRLAILKEPSEVLSHFIHMIMESHLCIITIEFLLQSFGHPQNIFIHNYICSFNCCAVMDLISCVVRFWCISTQTTKGKTNEPEMYKKILNLIPTWKYTKSIVAKYNKCNKKNQMFGLYNSSVVVQIRWRNSSVVVQIRWRNTLCDIFLEPIYNALARFVSFWTQDIYFVHDTSHFSNNCLQTDDFTYNSLYHNSSGSEVYIQTWLCL